MVDDHVATFEAEQAAREEAERERDNAVQERDSAVKVLRTAVRTILRGRGLPTTAEQEARLDSGTADELDRWLPRALTAASRAAVLEVDRT
jgi:hypothetical protein